MTRKQNFHKGDRVKIHGLDWFHMNKFNGKYTFNGRYEYPDKQIKKMAGKWGVILQYHEDVDLYDVEIGHVIYQVEETFFNDWHKYEGYDR